VLNEESPTSDLTEETESEASTTHSHSSRASPQSPPAVLMDGPSVSMVEETRTEKYAARQYSGKDKHHYSVPYDPQVRSFFLLVRDSSIRRPTTGRLMDKIQVYKQSITNTVVKACAEFR